MICSGGGKRYAWLVSGDSLPERKIKAEGRREELLTLLYQDKLTPSMLYTLPNGWVSSPQS